jgi:hypothetical protein
MYLLFREDGSSPLHAAMESRCLGLIRLLIDAGANIYCVTKVSATVNEDLYKTTS